MICGAAERRAVRHTARPLTPIAERAQTIMVKQVAKHRLAGSILVMEAFAFAPLSYARALKIAVFTSAILVAGCGRESAAPMEISPPERTFPVVLVTPSSVELAVGDTIRFHAVFKRGMTSIVWTSNHPDVVEIDSVTGFARARAAGWVTVTAALRDENFRGGAQVTVIPR